MELQTNAAPPSRIVVAMSGGIDSSVAAALLVEQGHEVIGLTAHMWRDGSKCCSAEDIQQARKVAWHLGITHHVLNADDKFKSEVVDPFVAEYLRGRTPSPCILCNQKIKFGFLLTRAAQLGCAALATGHYARVEQVNGAFHLYAGRDKTRDQSYFLHRLSQRQLAHSIFPLASLIKHEDVTAYARQKSLPLSSRGESQDLCFVANDDYGSFVETRSPGAAREGPIVDSNGKRLGTHKGLHNYTVGQRKGIGIQSPEPLYVVALDPAANTVRVGPRSETAAGTCIVRDTHWISGTPPSSGTSCQVRIRYRHEGASADLRLASDGSVEVHFREPQFAITPGQAAVFYDGDEVLGGGWIDRAPA